MIAVGVMFFDRKQNQPDIAGKPVAPVIVKPSSVPARPIEPKREPTRKIPIREIRQPVRLNTASAGGTRMRTAKIWYVIAATYNKREGAERRAREITRRWPTFKAEVFSPKEEKVRYLVIVGANLTEAAALALQKQALAAGLPGDTYVKRFPS